ncbi:hypothetical protein [Clostridium oryzae]|uniref:Uncharacterized protein n=1 Tax=Clostridium oryzae TaxID=1450648 RepID=A0A1V4IU41_9CLOT|nr:hypothetical protein [Clostridium oryzae]OPJ63413.1 hypothetical protein CLORY_11950 [Clostridium oryzae]
MDINKAIKKQKKSEFRFILFMCFIFFVFPILLIILKKFSSFFILYLCVVDFFVIMGIIYKKDSNKLIYSYALGRLRIKQGLFIRRFNIDCDKIVYVHTEKMKDGIRIVMLSKSKFRNENIKWVNKEVLRRHPYLVKEYNRLKKINPDAEYYLISIYRGGAIKYKLLMDIYKTCVKAKYSEAAIDNIKCWMI